MSAPMGIQQRLFSLTVTINNYYLTIFKVNRTG